MDTDKLDTNFRQHDELYAKEIVEELKELYSKEAVLSVQDVLTRIVQNGLKQFKERLHKTLNALQFVSLQSLTKMPSRLEHVLLYVENYVMQIFRDLLIRDPPVLSPSILQCEDPLKVLPAKPEKTKGDVYRETLQSSHEELMENLDPQGTPLVDHLVEKSILTVSDEESIATSGSRREKTRKILSIVSSSPADKIETFLSALEATHPDQADKFKTRYKEIEKRPPTPTVTPVCASCRIKDQVDLSRIASSMYQNRRIKWAVYEDLCNSSIPHHKKWKIIMESVKKQEAVIEALKLKYPEFFDQCKMLKMKTLECQCPVLDVRSQRKMSCAAPYLTNKIQAWWAADPSGPTEEPRRVVKSASVSSVSNMSGLSLNQVVGDYYEEDHTSKFQWKQDGDRIQYSSAASMENESDISEFGLGDCFLDISSVIPKRSRNQDDGKGKTTETVTKLQDSDTSDEEIKPQKKKSCRQIQFNSALDSKS